MSKGIIYCAHCLSTGKKYIGQTKQKFETRIKQHKKDSKKANYLFYRAINKHGWENFIWGIVEECNLNNVYEREVYWIAYYKSNNKKYGYNMTVGGEFGISKEILSKTGRKNGNYVYENKIGIFSYDSETKSNLGKIGGSKSRKLRLGIHSLTSQQLSNYGKIGGETRGKQLEKSFTIQSPDGVIYKSTNITHFCKLNNLTPSAISRVLNGKDKHHKRWTLPNVVLTQIKPEEHQNSKVYKIKNPNGEVQEIKNLTHFCRENNLSRKGFYSLFSNKTNNYKGWTLP